MKIKEFLATTEVHDKKTFGKFVTQRRIDLGISLRQLAFRLVISPAYMCEIEKGDRVAPIKLLREMILILHIGEDEQQDFIDLAYQTCEACAPDLIQYLISSREARQAIRLAIQKNIKAKDFLNIVEQIKEV